MNLRSVKNIIATWKAFKQKLWNLLLIVPNFVETEVGVNFGRSTQETAMQQFVDFTNFPVLSLLKTFSKGNPESLTAYVKLDCHTVV